MGLNLICYFHILIHALAKANLFIVIGRLIHSRFSQQDTRFIASRTLNSLLVLSIRIRLIRLVGVFFSAGFFSKEQILIGQSSVLNRRLSIFILFLVTGLTLAYCIKLFFSVVNLNFQRVFQTSEISISQAFPIFLIRGLGVTRGHLLSFNLDPYPLSSIRIDGRYWRLAITGVFFLLMRGLFLIPIYMGFYRQSKLIDILVKDIFSIKPVRRRLEASSREIIFLSGRYVLIKIIKQRIRIIFLFSILNLVFLVF